MLEAQYVMGQDYAFAYSQNKDGKVLKTIKVKHPKLKDIFDLEGNMYKYFEFISIFCIEPQDRMYELWKNGIDYEFITPYKFFLEMFKSYIKRENNMRYFNDMFKFFFNIDNVVYSISKDGEEFLIGIYENETEDYVIIDEKVYLEISKFLKKINNIQNKEKDKFISQTTKVHLMELNIEDGMTDEKGDTTFGSSLLYYINKNPNGINYFNVLDLPMYTFRHSIVQLNRIDDFGNLLDQINAGRFDSKKTDLNSQIKKHNPMATIFKEEK